MKIDLAQDLDGVVLSLSKPGSILIFPTRIAANRAMLMANRIWDLEERTFLSVEDLREALILPDQPVLTDEKRLLCLYLVMGETQREFFHLYSYGDIVDWGKRFFDFFEELAEECVEPETLAKLGESGTFHLQEWQELYLQRILQIRSDYRAYIGALGFTDRIFYLQAGGIKIPWTGRHLVYVNQYYYSALEKAQIAALEKQNQVTILTHGLDVDSLEKLKMREFDLESAWNSLPLKPDIQILDTDNETQMALAFLNCKQQMETSRGIVIDSGFQQKSYSRYFQQQGISLPDNYGFSQSSVYQLLAFISDGLGSVLDSGGYLSMRLLARFASSQSLIRYFLQLADPDALDRAMAEILREISVLLQKDYLYVDEALFEAQAETPLKQVVLGFYGLLNAFSKVSRITDLAALIDSAEGIVLNRLLSGFEREYTNIEAVLWERVANFLAIEQLGLVPSWQQIFPVAGLGQNLLELLLSYLKTARISFTRLKPEATTWEIGNLLDARNRSFDTVAVLQMVEGIMPSAPTPVWLFNEAQRAKLGLKTYAEIRSWERYYFFRLLLTSKRGLCFSYSNLERDISASSFLGELTQLLEKGQPDRKFIQTARIPMQELYKSNFSHPELPERDKDICCLDKTLSPDFFVIPCQPETDFKHNVVAIGASGLIQLLKNPFLWFVEYFSKLSRLDWEAEETIGSRLFGNIMHAYFAATLGELKGHHESLEKLQSVFGDANSLEKQLKELIASPRMRYQIPKNYNADFLGEIISRRLSDSIREFYDSWLKQKLENRSFELIPEEEEMQPEEQGYKSLGEVEHQGKTYRLAIRGRADLRIELENSAFIVDFKTGNHDSRQLTIYEWFYYLINELLPENNVSSVFWNILDSKATEGTKPGDRHKVKAQILESLAACLQSGFGMEGKVTDRTRLQSVTRADLYTGLKREVSHD